MYQTRKTNNYDMIGLHININNYVTPLPFSLLKFLNNQVLAGTKTTKNGGMSNMGADDIVPWKRNNGKGQKKTVKN